MYMYIYSYIYVHTHTHTHIYIRTFILQAKKRNLKHRDFGRGAVNSRNNSLQYCKSNVAIYWQ